MPDEHAKHSPSQLKYKSKCSQWKNDDSGPTQAADEGTFLHAIMEKWALMMKENEDK